MNVQTKMCRKQTDSAYAAADSGLVLHLADRDIRTSRPAFVMGIVNVTPDSFWQGSRGGAEHALQLVEEGADILDTYRAKRANILYKIDEGKAIRQSHNNPDIKKIYADFLGEPCGELSEKLLHTSYNANRERFPEKK